MRIISYLHNKPKLSISAGCYILQIFYKYEVLAMSNDNDYLDASYT